MFCFYSYFLATIENQNEKELNSIKGRKKGNRGEKSTANKKKGRRKGKL